MRLITAPILCIVAALLTSACTQTQEYSMPKTKKADAAKTVHEQSTFLRLPALSMPAPRAEKVTFNQEYHGTTISDDYAWLKNYPEVTNPAIIDYLEKENEYFTAFLAPKKRLVNTLFEEFKGRTNEQESSVPWVKNGYEYRSFFNQGEEYRTYSRRLLGSSEEVVFLSAAELAKPFDYFTMGDWEVSPNNQFVAYSYNTNGDERYKIVILNIATGERLSEELIDTNGSIAFSKDSQSIVYGALDSERWFTHSINLHKIGSLQTADVAILTEQDESYFMHFELTSSNEFLVVGSGQSEVSEIHIIPTHDFSAKPLLLVSREQGFLASVDHANGYFFILSNDTHVNSRLAKVADSDFHYKNWETVIAGSNTRYLMGMQAFKDFMVVISRENGIERFTIDDYTGNTHDVTFPETVFGVSPGNNPEFTQDFVRINYDSMITPSTVFDYKVTSKELITRKVQHIPSGYDKSNYVSKRIMAPARDGTLVPVTLVYHKDFKQNASQPMHLYGYGAYGYTITPTFSTTRLSLLDRGFSFAIAHVRGSDMLGHQWYLDGKLTKRNNSFNDFIDVAHHLIDEQYVAAGNISISGRSAGGELMGAVTVLAPQLWRSVTLGVPFVDVLNTMLDADLPLTPPEWSEWGNPIVDAEAFNLIKGYSPYDNIEQKDYPPMLVTGGLNDPRVTYWEPAKWTAKMREMKTDNNLIVMRINMGAGHFANSGRYGRLKDYAQEYAFMLTAHGIND